MRDVFISYANEDRQVADEIVAALEERDNKCWIAPRDIRPGANWADAIATAIGESRSVLLVLSRHTFASRHIAREVERADRTRRPLIPVFLEETETAGPLSYYLNAVQWLAAYPGPIARHVGSIADAVQDAMTEGVPLETSPTATLDEELVALARSICWDVRLQLKESVTPESVRKVDEPKHGQEVLVADLAAVSAARRSIADWTSRTGVAVSLLGEDVEGSTAETGGQSILCLLDALDGTQHWARGRDLWCTALSIFSRDDRGAPSLRVSAVHLANGSVVIAREDEQATFLEGDSTPLEVDARRRVEIEASHVCTVSRRPAHYRVLAPHLADGVPFAGLYTFGGNPILVELAQGRYDAVFQPDASGIDDPQELFDWLPGGHVAYRSGCTLLDLDGQQIDLLHAASEAIVGRVKSLPFVASIDPGLAREIVNWLGGGVGRHTGQGEPGQERTSKV